MRMVAAVVLFSILIPASARASCSVFGVQDPDGSIRFVGKSYDWTTQSAIVTANLAGYEKRALVFPSKTYDVPAGAVSWTSQWSSITFNQYGRDVPLAGLNIKGLVVESAEMDPGGSQLPGASYNPPGATETITSSQWIQYILDSFDSVQAFLDAPPAFAIMPSQVPIHFMVCDSTQCAVVEIVQNDLRITKGPDLGVQPSAGAFIPVIALTNDYYDCSVHGRDSQHSWALQDYVGFGGTRTPIPHYPGFCNGTNQQPGSCDQACRANGAWLNADSVQRFVSVADGSRRLSMKPGGATTADVFAVLNEAYSSSQETGGTKIQIVYDLRDLRISWRTVADGTDDDSATPTGLVGTPRSVAFHDFLGRGLLNGPCGKNADALVISIDRAPACPAPPGDSYTCNPNPDLAANLDHAWPWVPYREEWNRRMASYAASHSHISKGDFTDMVKSRLNGMTGLPAIADAAANQIMYNIWGGYPRGYTKCGDSVQPEQIVNLFLSSALGPYLTPVARSRVSDPLSITADGEQTYAGIPFTWHLPVTVHGTKKLELTNIELWKDPGKCGANDCFTFDGRIADGSLTLDTPYTVYLKAKLCVLSLCTWQEVGTITVKSLKVHEATFSLPGTGAHVDDDYSGAFCFLGSAKLDKDHEKVEVDIRDSDLSCTASVTGVPVPASTLCGWLKDALLANLEGELKDQVHDMAKDLIAQLPHCGVSTVAPPSRTTYVASWGDLAAGKPLTARVGHTYIVRGEITADKGSDSYEFATIDEVDPGSGADTRVASVRMTAARGSNQVTARWTPTSAGEKDLRLDVFRWDEVTDEAAPAVIRVRVFPLDGPASWADRMFEGLSTKLEEAP